MKVTKFQKTVSRRDKATGKMKATRTATWYLNYGKGDIRSTGIADEAMAEQLREREEAKLVLSSHGMPVPGDYKRALTEYLDDYEAKLSAPDGNAEYVTNTIAMIGKAIKACKWQTAMSITAADANNYAVKLREGRTSRTVHSHLTALKGFTRWLVAEGKLPADPLAGVKKPSSKRTARRRFLLHEEWKVLRRVALAEDQDYKGMSAANRILLYAVAIQTGLRQGELRDRKRSNLFLDRPDPFITCPWSATKNGQDAKQYIRPELAAELKANLKGHGKLFPCLPDRQSVATMLRADLAAARAAWLEEAPDEAERALREQSDFLLPINHGGEHLDFHSLRHTTGAWLALAGVHPKVVQAVMRHSTITLTMDAYGHLFPGQAADAILKLPNMNGE